MTMMCSDAAPEIAAGAVRAKSETYKKVVHRIGILRSDQNSAPKRHDLDRGREQVRVLRGLLAGYAT